MQGRRYGTAKILISFEYSSNSVQELRLLISARISLGTAHRIALVTILKLLCGIEKNLSLPQLFCPKQIEHRQCGRIGARHSSTSSCLLEKLKSKPAEKQRLGSRERRGEFDVRSRLTTSRGKGSFNQFLAGSRQPMGNLCRE